MPRKLILRAPMWIVDSVDTRTVTTQESTQQPKTQPRSPESPKGLTEEQKRDSRSAAWGFYSSLSKNYSPDCSPTREED